VFPAGIFFGYFIDPSPVGAGRDLLKIGHDVQSFSHFQDTRKYLLVPACAYKFLTICKINVLANAYLGVDQNLLSHALGLKSASD
jgi:hypothetical protein